MAIIKERRVSPSPKMPFQEISFCPAGGPIIMSLKQFPWLRQRLSPGASCYEASRRAEYCE